jgi:hypothetical protein
LRAASPELATPGRPRLNRATLDDLIPHHATLRYGTPRYVVLDRVMLDYAMQGHVRLDRATRDRATRDHAMLDHATLEHAIQGGATPEHASHRIDSATPEIEIVFETDR